MGTSRRRRISRDEGERLLATGRDPAHPELSRLLSTATAPPRPDELAGLRAAVAAFEEAGRVAHPVTAPRRRRVLRPLAAAAALATLLAGGVAVAAETGNLPGGDRAPAVSGTSRAGAPPDDTTHQATPGQSPSGTPTTAPAPRDRGTTPGPTSPDVAGLCRAWDAQRRNPNREPISAEAMRNLAAAAGGEERIPAFCAGVLAGPATHPGTVPPTPSHPAGPRSGKPAPSPAKKG